MTQGPKDKYSAKQKREAGHIKERYEKSRISIKEASRRAWDTINKMYSGGAKGGSGTQEI